MFPDILVRSIGIREQRPVCLDWAPLMPYQKSIHRTLGAAPLLPSLTYKAKILFGAKQPPSSKPSDSLPREAGENVLGLKDTVVVLEPEVSL